MTGGVSVILRSGGTKKLGERSFASLRMTGGQDDRGRQCHSEERRDEEAWGKILRFAQDDRGARMTGSQDDREPG